MTYIIFNCDVEELHIFLEIDKWLIVRVSMRTFELEMTDDHIDHILSICQKGLKGIFTYLNWLEKGQQYTGIFQEPFGNNPIWQKMHGILLQINRLFPSIFWKNLSMRAIHENKHLPCSRIESETTRPHIVHSHLLFFLEFVILLFSLLLHKHLKY